MPYIDSRSTTTIAAMQCTDAIAFEAAAALDSYGEQLAGLRGEMAAPARIASMQQELRRVCGCCARVPELSGPSIALLLAHHRLLADLARHPEPDAQEDAASMGAVDQCLALLQRRCRELLLAPHLQ